MTDDYWGSDAATRSAMRDAFVAPYEAQLGGLRGAMSAATDFGAYQRLENASTILQTNIEWTQPPTSFSGGQFAMPDYEGWLAQKSGGAAAWSSLSPEQQRLSIDSLKPSFTEEWKNAGIDNRVGDGQTNYFVGEVAKGNGIPLSGRDARSAASKMRKSLRPPAKASPPPPRHSCTTCHSAEAEKEALAAKKKAEKEKAEKEEAARREAAAAAPGAGPSTDKAAAALQRVQDNPGAAVVGVVDTKTGAMAYGNSVARDFEGPVRPDGFLPTNGGHQLMYQQLTGAKPLPGSGGSLLAFTITDQRTSFKSGGVNELLHSNIDGPSWMIQDALPHLQREFGTVAVPSSGLTY